MFTLYQIFDRAVDKTFLSPELRAKDEAFTQTEDAMRRITGLGKDEPVSEDELLLFAAGRNLKFDNGGNLIG